MVIDENLFAERLVAKLAACFGVVAASLAAIGIYGLLSYVVIQRTREIGIRMALGAEERDVLRLVLGQGMAVTSVGLGVGLVSALALSRYLSNLLYGVRSSDLPTFLIASLGLVGLALLASYIPARRATKVDPTVALRHE
jgi:ABC-type antimicrobial peptide transport system permease subunit